MDIKNKDQHSTQVVLKSTHKQLERDIAHRFRTFNREKIGCVFKEVTCTIFNNYLVLLVDGALTALEETIYKSGETKIVETLRQSVNLVLKQELRQIVNEMALVDTKDLVCELNYETKRLIVFAIMTSAPAVRKKRKTDISVINNK
ncbi:MAG: Na-translocating system protein MpsC family protein [Cyanobacteria bacterium P01_C01_bin.72]